MSSSDKHFAGHDIFMSSKVFLTDRFKAKRLLTNAGDLVCVLQRFQIDNSIINEADPILVQHFSVRQAIRQIDYFIRCPKAYHIKKCPGKGILAFLCSSPLLLNYKYKQHLTGLQVEKMIIIKSTTKRCPCCITQASFDYPCSTQISQSYPRHLPQCLHCKYQRKRLAYTFEVNSILTARFLSPISASLSRITTFTAVISPLLEYDYPM